MPTIQFLDKDHSLQKKIVKYLLFILQTISIFVFANGMNIA